MSSLALVLLFIVMVAAPCAVAMLASRMSSETDAVDADDGELSPVPAGIDKKRATAMQPVKPLTLEELVLRAEKELCAAHELTRQAHRNALAASARLAALRADAAAEAASIAGKQADDAIRAAEAEFDREYLPETHPSLDFPRSRRRGRAA